MKNYKHVPQYIRYFYYPDMWDKSTHGTGKPSSKTNNPVKETRFTMINTLISYLTEKQRKKLFYWIYRNYKQEVVQLIHGIKQNQKQG